MFRQVALKLSCLVVPITLSLFLIGTAWGVAEVESRSAASKHDEGGWKNSGSDNITENNSLDVLKKLEFLQQEVQELRGRLEEQGYQLQQAQEQQKKLYLDLDKRLQSSAPKVGQPIPPGALNSELNKFDDKNPELPLGSPSMSQQNTAEEKAYQQGYRYIQMRDYERARSTFESLLAQYPNGQYAPNTQHWLGEIHLIQGNFEQATQFFDSVYRLHPLHPKAADSLLKLGYVECGKGQFKRAQALLNQVQSQFPGTTSAQLAQARLQKMRHEGKI